MNNVNNQNNKKNFVFISVIRVRKEIREITASTRDRWFAKFVVRIEM